MSIPRMPDLEPNPKHKQPQAPKAKRVIRKKREATTARVTSRQQAKTPVNPKKELPRSSASQPRDHLGRFASTAGAVLWGAAKGTARVVAGGVKVARSAHKAVSRAKSSARRRANLEMRERAVTVREREKKLGKKKVIRRKKGV